MSAITLSNEDYIYCEDCKMYIDFWKYDHDIHDAGHSGCRTRFVTDTELVVLKDIYNDCVYNGCLGGES